MKEVVKRRYERLREENASLPDLIITDGGKGQMEAVRKALEEINIMIPIAGLAKDKKHRTSEFLYGFPAQTIGLKQGTPLFKFTSKSCFVFCPIPFISSRVDANCLLLRF